MNRRKQPNTPSLAPVAPANPVLQRLLEQGANSPDDARLALLRELQAASLLVPILQTPERTGAGRQPNLQIAALENSDGRILVGFADVDAYGRFPAVQHLAYAAIAAADLCRFARDGNFRSVYLNPGGPIGYELSPLEYQMVAERLIPGEDNALVLEQPTLAVIGMPSERPSEDTLQAMREQAQIAGAQEVWWFWMALAGGIPHLGLAVSPPDTALVQTLGSAIAPIWKAARPENSLLDILPLGDNNELSDTIRDKGECLLPSG